MPGVEIVSVYNRTREKAEELSRRFGIARVYTDAEEMVRRERPDVLDVITAVETHGPLVRMAAEHRVAVICQKPMATTLREAMEMVAACREAGVKFYVHENWRWQTPIRAVKRVLDSGVIGRAFRGRISMVSGFPVFVNQPFFKTLEQFILMDMGSHLLDVARFLFGEATRLYCQTQRVHGDIKGEDVATVMMEMNGATVVVEMGYAENPLEREAFPETSIFVEGEKGSVELTPGYWVRTTTAEGTHAKRWPPPRYAWAEAAYDVVQSSIVACNEDLLAGLRGARAAETTGEDNLKTVKLVHASYESSRRGSAYQFEASRGGT